MLVNNETEVNNQLLKAEVIEFAKKDKAAARKIQYSTSNTISKVLLHCSTREHSTVSVRAHAQ